jgi:hypothetical protein
VDFGAAKAEEEGGSGGAAGVAVGKAGIARLQSAVAEPALSTHMHHLLGFGKAIVGYILENFGIVDGGMAIRDLDMPPTLQGSEHHEQIGRAVACIFMGPMIDFEDIFNGGHESSVGLRRDHPLLTQVRLQEIFLASVRSCCH